MILRANATKIFEQTDNAGDRDVRNISVVVALSSNRQQKSGTHIGMSMQRPRHHQLKRGTKCHCARSLDINSQMTVRHADGARKLAPKPPCGATRTRTRADALTHMVNERIGRIRHERKSWSFHERPEPIRGNKSLASQKRCKHRQQSTLFCLCCALAS